MSDFTKGMCSGDMDRAMRDIEWMERATRREYAGCKVCRHQYQVFEDVYGCDLEKKPLPGRLFCARWDEK